jgi:hypothetical protein
LNGDAGVPEADVVAGDGGGRRVMAVPRGGLRISHRMPPISGPLKIPAKYGTKRARILESP